jgi:hypothetical protein
MYMDFRIPWIAIDQRSIEETFTQIEIDPPSMDLDRRRLGSWQSQLNSSVRKFRSETARGARALAGFGHFPDFQSFNRKIFAMDGAKYKFEELVC